MPPSAAGSWKTDRPSSSIRETWIWPDCPGQSGDHLAMKVAIRLRRWATTLAKVLKRAALSAAAIGSGLWGIEQGLEPTPAIIGNAYEQKPAEHLALPATLGEAARNLKASKAARALFGDAFVDHFAATREWEEREARRAITDWQLARYFEII